MSAFAFWLQRQSEVATEASWPEKPQVFIIWFFTEKVWPPLMMSRKELDTTEQLNNNMSNKIFGYLRKWWLLVSDLPIREPRWRFGASRQDVSYHFREDFFTVQDFLFTEGSSLPYRNLKASSTSFVPNSHHQGNQNVTTQVPVPQVRGRVKNEGEMRHCGNSRGKGVTYWT